MHVDVNGFLGCDPRVTRLTKTDHEHVHVNVDDACGCVAMSDEGPWFVELVVVGIVYTIEYG